MGIYVTGYTEARINGKWHCIDFFQRDLKGKLRLVPCIEGASMVRHALEWDCNVQRLMVPPEDISDGNVLQGKEGFSEAILRTMGAGGVS